MTRRFLVRRVWQALIVLLAAYTVAFLLLAALPGDAIMARYASPELGLSPAQIEEIRVAYGADEPVLVRYAETLFGFLIGDFGNSLKSGASVGALLLNAIPSTLALAVCGLGAGVVVAFVLAITATYGHVRWVRRLVRSFPPVMVSLPAFWVAIILVQFFSFRLGWVPTIGASPVEALILPTLTLAIPMGAPLAQVLIASIDEVNREDFVDVVKARGARPGWILWHNVLRNASLPVLTMSGVLFTELVSNAVVTETVFGRTGIGSLTVEAVASRDTPILMAIVVLAALLFVVISFLVDLAYPVIDRRIKLEEVA
ncbi:MAG: ABC transporter permease [Ancrocorticia sp.]